VHRVFGEIAGAHRLKGACADMQRHARDRHAAGAQRVEDRVVEVQSRGRRGDGARLVRIDGLIARFVGGFRRALDIRRKRYGAVRIEQREHVAAALEPQAGELTVALDHRRFEAAGE
jgi:hypothetical protein